MRALRQNLLNRKCFLLVQEDHCKKIQPLCLKLFLNYKKILTTFSYYFKGYLINKTKDFLQIDHGFL